MCGDCKDNSEKKCCGFFAKIFGCKCGVGKSCCGKAEEKKEAQPKAEEKKEEGKI